MIGKTISHYKILEKLGEGGMGVVYKAEDTKLERTVALKFLSLTSIGDEEKKRFKREAKAAASLNHPNIATIHAIDEADDQTFIAMEFVDGQSLQEIVGGKPMPIDKAIDYATQTAAGLQAAHKKGITHRDIKSANIMITEDGQVKIMDFGLAKLANRSKLTQLGTTLGTAAYMSPEQSRGENTDHRADIWSLGVVLYEMISGQMPFKGDYEQAVIYSIQNEEPEPLTALRSGLPIALDGIIAKALAKDADTRYQNVEELPADLQALKTATLGQSRIINTTTRSGAVSSQRWRWTIPWGIALVSILMALVFMSLWLTRPHPFPERPLRKFELYIKGLKAEPWRHPVLSPDGSRIAYLSDGTLWVRELDRLDPRQLVKGQDLVNLFWSPDGAQLAYIANGKLWRVAAVGGEPNVIAAASFERGSFTPGGVWMPNGQIVFAPAAYGTGLIAVSAQGGDFTPFLERQPDDGDFHSPGLLPDGRGILFVVDREEGGPDTIELLTGDSRKRVLRAVGERFDAPVYSPTGHILYQRETTNPGIWALPFSLDELKPIGEPFLVVPEAGWPGVSSDGTLIFTRGDPALQTQLAWVDRGGRVEAVTPPRRGMLLHPRISPDGQRIVVNGRDDSGEYEIFSYNLSAKTWTRLTFGGGRETAPVWAPGNRIVYYDRQPTAAFSSIFVKPADGTGEAHRITSGATPRVTRDGRFLIFFHVLEGRGADLWTLRLDPVTLLPLDGEQPVPFLQAPLTQWHPEISPDDRYVAYESFESGRPEIFVTQFPKGDGKWQVSTSGGARPRWNRSGDRLYFIQDNDLMEVVVQTEPTVAFSSPKQVVSGSPELLLLNSQEYDVAPDGQRFLVVQRVSSDSEALASIAVVQNWFAEFEKK